MERGFAQVLHNHHLEDAGYRLRLGLGEGDEAPEDDR